MPSLILAIDTAFSRCTAALFDPRGDGRLLAAAEPEIGKGHAERLTGVIDSVLAEAGVAYGDLARIVVTTGPGSFTGVRVGVAAARGLALALAVPAIGVSTLDALAACALGGSKAQNPAAPVLAVLDARRDEVYAALYAADGAMISAAAALAPEALGDVVAACPAATPLILVGTGAKIAADQLAARPTTIEQDSDRIDPETLARLGATTIPGEPPRPLYLRGADAKPSSMRSLRAVSIESIP
ncbi:tRNA (adenosine(37)-N6)-threonylcarbamoyltransferase complex dimerization subunit type 1 TsaB [Jiella sp. MQZ9-1]|uniref:tRNA (Adenosine(37)-N6)-threonylcarbamoyltransferase complex dimerization subunit type 1 TsaB n=1 Tax=Jiella flava TaxID=2816857 RepID=A0A939JUF2_9HYPH|nr:tRNA (adenosine(37)-N6)-threonylcarbamoyltransferase complex dimerization subunit type 1 TsaB [Jiella flava]MBO0661354.1 tRNA (adenosine(37)-N6)-threonylcarbamoyltransferase complex dimerization subunit type 1 TsaB [Jiella flava]MCD2469999.1 tRNA (adenosine(37)-N6)-threonylcarbamoyltransferase complex dimerization subunit type 1 TsaB [Jiella flava]